MVDLDQIITNFIKKDNTLSRRVLTALEYRNAVAHRDITKREYIELVKDLQVLDGVKLTAAEKEQQIAFNECMTLLIQTPLP